MLKASVAAGVMVVVALALQGESAASGEAVAAAANASALTRAGWRELRAANHPDFAFGEAISKYSPRLAGLYYRYHAGNVLHMYNTAAGAPAFSFWTWALVPHLAVAHYYYASFWDTNPYVAAAMVVMHAFEQLQSVLDLVAGPVRLNLWGNYACRLGLCSVFWLVAPVWVTDVALWMFVCFTPFRVAGIISTSSCARLPARAVGSASEY